MPSSRSSTGNSPGSGPTRPIPAAFRKPIPPTEAHLILVVPDRALATFLRTRTFLFSTNPRTTTNLHILVDTSPNPDIDTVRLLVGMAELGLNLDDIRAIRPTLALGDATK